MTNNKITGEAFREIREQMAYTREGIAKEIGVSWETVKSWETRKSKQEIPRYARMALMRIQITHDCGTSA